MGIEDDRFMNNIENHLSNAASTPIVGSVAGLVHATVGTVQAVSAIAITIVAIPYAVLDPSLRKRSWHHVEHGFGNIAAGIIETIPFAGMVMNAKRDSKIPIDNGSVHVETGHERKWMPYSSLEKNDLRIVGREGDPHFEEANALFKTRVNQHRKKQNAEPSLRRLKHLSKKSIIDTQPPAPPKPLTKTVPKPAE